MEQGVGAREQEQGGVPEPDQIAHEGLLVGKHEPRDDDLELGQDDQEGKPGESDGSGQSGNDQRDADQREMHELAAEPRLAERLRELRADRADQQALDPEEGDRHVDEADQEHAPEGGARDIGGDCGQCRGVAVHRTPAPPGIDEGRQDRRRVGRELEPAERRAGGVEAAPSGVEAQHAEMAEQPFEPGPAAPEDQIVADREYEGDGGRREGEAAQRGRRPAAGGHPRAPAGEDTKRYMPRRRAGGRANASSARPPNDLSVRRRARGCAGRGTPDRKSSSSPRRSCAP